MITEEIKEKNYRLYLKKLEQIGINTIELDSQYKYALMNEPFTNINDYGNAYNGSLIEIVLKVLTPYAVRLNELLPELIQCDKNSLVKVCLLHHIAKSVRLVPNDNQWEVEKRLMVYRYRDDNPAIRNGLHSLSICQECGIQFTLDEVEAMTINDRDLSDPQARYHSNVLSSIVRMANELTYIQINQ